MGTLVSEPKKVKNPLRPLPHYEVGLGAKGGGGGGGGVSHRKSHVTKRDF